MEQVLHLLWWNLEYLSWQVSQITITSITLWKKGSTERCSLLIIFTELTVPQFQAQHKVRMARKKNVCASSLHDKINMLPRVNVIIQREMLNRDTKNSILSTSRQSTPGGWTFTLRHLQRNKELVILRSAWGKQTNKQSTQVLLIHLFEIVCLPKS